MDEGLKILKARRLIKSQLKRGLRSMLSCLSIQGAILTRSLEHAPLRTAWLWSARRLERTPLGPSEHTQRTCSTTLLAHRLDEWEGEGLVVRAIRGAIEPSVRWRLST
jgi:hypothetical protein